jgi:hypothetical protein
MLKTSAVAGVAVVALWSAAAGYARPDFRTPGKAAYCDLYPGKQIQGGVEGSFTEGPPGSAAIECWTPNDGFRVRMSNRGSVPPHEYWPDYRGFTPRTKHLLGFGDSVALAGIRCVSRRSGLTCTNRSGHGWWIGRYRGYRIR